MQQVTTSITPLPDEFQLFPACPFYPLLGHTPLVWLPGRRSVTKYAPSAAMLTGEAGTNPVLSRLQGWGIPAQASMPGIAYDLSGATLNYGAHHG
jgi:hypothetical protein